MSESDRPVLWVLVWIGNNQAWLYAGALTLIVALIRAFLDHGRILRQDVADALLCGIFVTVSKPLLAQAGFNDDWALFYAVLVGMLGVRFVRPLIETVGRLFSDRVAGRRDTNDHQ